MVPKLTLHFLVAVIFMLTPNVSKAISGVNSASNSSQTIFELEANELVSLSKKELEDKIGRKLTLKEKIGFTAIQRKLKKDQNLTTTQVIEQVQIDGLAIAGFVTGLVSIFIFGLILGILGIVFSGIALRRIQKNPETRKGKGLAIAGLVLGIVGIIGWIIAISLFF